MNKCIIVDIDGTVAEKGNRSPFNWPKVGLDTPRKNVIEVVEKLSTFYKVIFFSGRDSVCYNESLEWLKKYINIPEYNLYMRKENDNRKDSIIKEELYNEHIKDQYEVLCIFDDRDQVVEMWRNKLGLDVMQVNYGAF